MVTEVPVSQARAQLSDLINRVGYGHERVVLTRHGKPLVALVPAADLSTLEHAQDAPQPQTGRVHVLELGTETSAPPREAAARYDPEGPGSPRAP